MKKKWLKKGAVALTVGVFAVGALTVSADNGFGMGHGGFGRGGDALAVVAEQLGIEPADLLTELQAGKTIAALAEEQGIATDTIVDAVVSAQQENLTSAVEAGTLTQAQADARLQLLEANVAAMLDQTFPAPDGDGRGFGLRGGFGRGDGLLAVVAEQLGIEQAELMTELQAGKTIAALAEEQGIATDAIVEAMVATQQERLTSAVEAGTLTQAQADARLELARTQAQELLNGILPERGFGGPGRDGFGGRGPGGDGFGRGPGGMGVNPPQPGTQTSPDATTTPNV